MTAPSEGLAVAAAVSPADLDRLQDEALGLLDSELGVAVELRHAMHRDPRLGGDEQATSALVRDCLEGPTTDLEEGLFARIGAPSGPAVALRAELDGLPIQEDSALPWSSATPGVAHLCGHDVHTAALVAAARTLRRIDTPVPLIAVFQPREEVIPSGAEDFVRSSDLLSQDIHAMIGVHLQPVIASGSVSAAAGAINASADNFEITMIGRPSHGAYPHLSRDPIVAAAALVQSIQHLVSRRTNPMNPAVVTVGKIAGGDSHNQVPGEVSLYGTIRSFSEVDREHLHEALRTLADGIAMAHGCTAETVIDLGEPVLHNNAELALFVTRALEAHGFPETAPVRSCGADDFAFYGSKFPSLMIFAGVGDGRATSPGLHHPKFVPADSVVADVARVMILAYFAAARDLLQP